MAAHDMAAGSVSVQTTGGKPSSAFRCVCCSARKERQGFLVLKQCLSSDTIGCATTTPFSAFCCVSTLPTAFLSLPSTVPTAFLSLPFSVPILRNFLCLSFAAITAFHQLLPPFTAVRGDRREPPEEACQGRRCRSSSRYEERSTAVQCLSVCVLQCRRFVLSGGAAPKRRSTLSNLPSCHLFGCMNQCLNRWHLCSTAAAARDADGAV